jgi:hypothetical protein
MLKLNCVSTKGRSLKNVQNLFLANVALLDDALFLFDGGMYALGSAFTAVNICTFDSI